MLDVELRVPADVQYVGLARLVVTTAARQAGMTNDRIEDLKIAVSEATANAIQAHLRAGDSQPVALQFGPTGADQFDVTIADSGYVPAEGDVSGRDWGGDGNLGLTLIRGLADVVDFDGRSDRTSVHMRFTVGLTPPVSRANGS